MRAADVFGNYPELPPQRGAAERFAAFDELEPRPGRARRHRTENLALEEIQHLPPRTARPGDDGGVVATSRGEAVSRPPQIDGGLESASPLPGLPAAFGGEAVSRPPSNGGIVRHPRPYLTTSTNGRSFSYWNS